MDRARLVAACASAEAIVAGVVAAEVLESPLADAYASRPGASERADLSDAIAAGLEGDKYADGDEYADADDFDDFAADAPPRAQHLPSRFLRLNEPWRGRVRREVVADAVERVETAARELSAAIDADLAPLLRRADEAATRSKRKRACFLEHDQRNNALWLRHVSASEARAATDAGVLFGATRGPVGEEVTDRWSTERVERAADAYRVAAVQRAAPSRRRSASARVCAGLVCLGSDRRGTFSAITTALSLHAKHALARGWHPATLLAEGDVATPWTTKNLTPFWMPRDGGAVPNDVAVSGLVLLTGPNMAGKSTVLRTTAASALLAACGLFVPADAAAVPHFDSLVVRMSSTDSPAEGLSSYAVEMAEVRAMLDVVTPESLVFIDELGRGTEAAHGTAMGGAVVEALDAAGARGMLPRTCTACSICRCASYASVTRAKMETVPEAVPEAVPEGGTAGTHAAPNEARAHVACRARRVPREPRAADGDRHGRARGTSSPGGSASRGRARRSGARYAGGGGHEDRSSSSSSRPGDVENVETGGLNDVVRGVTRSRFVSLETLRSALAEEFESLLAKKNGSSVDRRESRGHEKTPGAETAEKREANVGYVGFDETPSAASGAWTCVYVLRRADGWAYCGETDDLARRLETHRAAARRERAKDAPSRGREIECVFVNVPKTSGGKSAARLLESRVIRRLTMLDAPLLSGRDARNVSFGSGMAE